MNAKLTKFSALATLSSVLFFGCANNPIRSISPEKVSSNSLGTYTLTMSTDITVDQSVDGTYKPSIVIDGTPRRMKPSRLGDHFWEYEYKMPKGQEVSHYYYEIEWVEHHHAANTKHSLRSDIYSLQVTDRAVFSLETDRSHVGSKVGIIGRGFTAQDKVKVGDVFAPTHYASLTSLNFTVPPVTSDKHYRIQLVNGDKVTDVGTLFVAPSGLHLSESPLQLTNGEKKVLSLHLDQPAPAGGLFVEITTDIPESIVMSEVTVPSGETSKTVKIQGGKPGKGSLFIKANGYAEEQISVTVR
ncbi:MAG: hypothetical protein A2007_05290 [Verrucomicrobia bacterium GWC2_42_7]|nr:MAG: hypothetical protein A2007_05290 [Verrucomicrobia bacterium GWC2_42_7]